MGQASWNIETEIYPYLPKHIRRLLEAVRPEILGRAVEIRMRAHQPLLLVLPEQDYVLTESGAVRFSDGKAYISTVEDVLRVVQAIAKNSFYALEEELRMGYITIDGGHRIGLAGQAIMEQGRLKAVKNINSLNIRIAREVKQCANVLMPYLFHADGRVKNCLVIAPPRCGKTTLLRDIVRNLSNGSVRYSGVQVGVVDERSEIGASKNGRPTADLGCRTDILDGCPKAVGILMMIRTMAPAVVVTDELGREEDAEALAEALTAGVGVIASVHGGNVREVAGRPHVDKLIREKYFDCYILLSDQPSVGTVRAIVSAKDGQMLYGDGEGREKLCCLS